ncbi:MAG: carboxy-S-adenosyl-L-methionine synthase CmoA, partial [Pseudomonadales bacterium]
SVPGYDDILHNISHFAQRFVKAESQCYDLGCSLGASSLAMSRGIQVPGVKIIGVDNSRAMLKRCQQHIEAYKHQTEIELHCADILDFEIDNASMAVLNFTLQFIEPAQREQLLKRVFQGMNSSGVLILSEKVRLEVQEDDQLIIDLHHQFKRENGYSNLEISQKRNLLENVLLPDTLNEHLARLHSIGFSRVCCWQQRYNFVSIYAVK